MQSQDFSSTLMRFCINDKCPLDCSNIGCGVFFVCVFYVFGLALPWFNNWFSFTLVYSRISYEYSSLFIIVINLIFMFSL